MLEELEEIELKLRLLNPEEAPKISKTLEFMSGMELPLLENRLESTYYDTADRLLFLAGWTYRIRKEEESWVATVKGMGTSEGGLHKRREWNLSIAEPEASIEAFDYPEIQQTLREVVGEKALEPMIKTIFTRTKGLWKDDEGNIVEIAIDTGYIEAGKNKERIDELELELKAGKTKTLMILGKVLSEQYALMPAKESKFFRGVKLLGLKKERENPQKKEIHTVDIDGISVSKGRYKTTVKAFEQINGALELLIKHPMDLEKLHQLRVGIRNLRSILFLFKPSIDPKDYNRINLLLQQWHQETNEIRELDVMKINLMEWIESLDHPEKVTWMVFEVEKELEKKRRDFYKRLKGGEMTSKILEIGYLLEGLSSASSKMDTEIAAKEFVHKRLDEQIKAFNRKTKKTSIDNSEELHRLRIRGKKIRYSIQNIKLGNDEKRKTKKSIDKALKAAKKLQTLLGDIHDSHCETNWMKFLANRREMLLEDMEYLGRYVGWQISKQNRLKKTLVKHWEKTQVRKL